METVDSSSRPRTLSVVKAPIPRRLRTAWISDVHLGTRTSNAEALLHFLRDHELETLYIVGDLIDGWQMRRGIYWAQRKLRPEKGRRKDLRKIDSLIEDVRLLMPRKSAR